jgi:hypothetical protein
MSRPKRPSSRAIEKEVGVWAMLATARVQLSERQWSAIAHASDLPESAKESIESLLAWYQVFQQASVKRPRAGHTRNELLRIAKLAGDLITAIIGDNADGSAALSSGLDEGYFPIPKILSGSDAHLLAALMPQAPHPAANAADIIAAIPASPVLDAPKRDALKLLCERLSVVEQLRLWFENAGRSLPADTRGGRKAAENHQWLVGQLDGILTEYTGRHISRSYKAQDLQRFVRLCFAAADSNVGSGSIKKAIEAYVRLNPRHRTARAQIPKEKRT